MEMTAANALKKKRAIRPVVRTSNARLVSFSVRFAAYVFIYDGFK